jgi:hypothetical protein
MAIQDESLKPTGKLKEFLKAGSINSRVLTKVERYVLTLPEDTSRRSDVLHPSAMVKDDWCHRASYFQLLGYPTAPTKINLSKKRIFKMGHDIHAAWQDIFGQMEKLWGIWECNGCKSRNVALSTFDGFESVCSDCSEGYTYKEVSLFYEPLRISGHADGILVGFDEPLLLEIKSIGVGTFRFEASQLFAEHDGNFDKMWKALDAPFMSHIKQAQLYMKLAELLELPYQPQEALFLYENKANQSLKEFVVAKSDFGVAHILEDAAKIVAAVDRREPITCNISPNNGCSQCKGYNDVQS